MIRATGISGSNLRVKRCRNDLLYGEPLPEGYTGGVPGSRPGGRHPRVPVRSRFAAKAEEAAASASRGWPRYTLAALSRGDREESNALPG